MAQQLADMRMKKLRESYKRKQEKPVGKPPLVLKPTRSTKLQFLATEAKLNSRSQSVVRRTRTPSLEIEGRSRNQTPDQ